ncbi:MAG: hypothetical protein WB952_24610 [Terriglobales bacterium]
MRLGRTLGVGWLTIVLAGCGGGSNMRPAGFLNQTRHSDVYLWATWKTAQRTLATRIDLNPLQQSAENAAPVVLPGDSRALNINPQQLTVVSEPDVSSQAFLAATGKVRPDPTGMIVCPQPCDASYTPAYSLYRPELTKYAASWESVDSDFDTILEYEFENQILFALGYDMRWR